jgi:hypothetical protein
VLRLALLGTAIGFILMLIPISGLSSFEAGTLRTALGGMTGGMAIALNVTVTGIASSLVLKLEYYMLDNAIEENVRHHRRHHGSLSHPRVGASGQCMSRASLQGKGDDGTFVPFTDILPCSAFR